MPEKSHNERLWITPLDEETNKAAEEYIKKHGLMRAEFVRMAIAKFLGRPPSTVRTRRPRK